jgi:hypothetical protein
MFTGPDGVGGKSDDLTVFMDACAGLYIRSGDFMAERNRIDTGYLFFCNLGPGRNLGPCDDHIIGIMQTNGKGF